MDFAGMKRRELQALCKRHGLPAGGTNADLVARLDAALSGAAGAEEEDDVVGVVARKGCLKRSVGDAGEAKKVTFAVEESRGRRPRSRVVWSPVVAKTRGKRAEAGNTDSADDAGISARAGENVPVRRSRRNSLTAAEVDEVEEAVAVGRKRKPKSQEIAEDAAVSAQPVASCRVTRRSSLSGTSVLLPPAVEKKRGKGKATDGKNKIVTEEPAAEAQGLSAAAPPTVVESKKIRRKGPDVQNSSRVEVSARITRSRSVEAVVMSPPVLENKRKRKSGDAQPDVELRPVAEVPRNDAPVTRSLRNRVVQVNNSILEGTHTSQQPENKTQPTRPATRRNQQVASSMEEEDQEQAAAPSKAPPSKRSRRNNSEASDANSESNKLVSAPVEAKDSKIAHPSKAEDVEKQPIVKEPSRRSTRKSVVSAMLDNEKDLIEEKNPEAHARRSMRRSIVPVEDMKGAGEEIQNAKGEDAAKQPAVKEPVRRSTRKSVVSAMLEKEKVLIAEKNPEAHVRRSMRKSVVPVKDINGVGEDIQNAKSEDMEKQLVVNQPVRRSSRKSVLPDMLENESGSLVAETNAEAHVRARKSVLPNMLNEEDPGHSKIARNENFQIGKCEDEKQQKVKEPVRRSRRSVATVMLEEQNKGLHERKMAAIPLRRSTRKSIALNVVENGSNHTEKVGREQSGVRTRRLKARDDQAVAVEPVVTSGNDLQVDVQNNQGLQRSTVKSPIHNLSDGNETHPGSDKFVLGERVGEEGLKLRKHRRSSMEISSPANEFCNMEDFIGQKFRKQQSTQTPSEKDKTGASYNKPQRVQQASTPPTSKGRSSKRRRTRITAPEEVVSAEEANDGMVIREETMDAHEASHEYSKESSSRTQEICQSVHKVIPGSETGGLAKESSEKSKQLQEHYDIQADDSHLSEIRNEELNQSSSIAELFPHNDFVSEDKTLMGEDVLPVDFTIGDDKGQSPVAGQGRVGWEANTSESGEKNLADAMSTGLHTKSLQHDIDILAKESGEAFGSSGQISDSNPEVHCDAIAEESIRAADLGSCPSNDGKGNPLLKNLHDSIPPVMNSAQGFSSDGRRSSFGLEFLFTEECKESCSRNVENIAVEVDGGNKSSTCVTPDFYVGSDCGLEDEDVQPTGFDADKKLDVDQDVTEEEVVIEEKSYDEHVAAKTDLRTKLNGELTGLDMESDCCIAENNVRLVADNPDNEEVAVQVQQADVQEGDPEKPSQFSATPECKHECGLPEETALHSKKNKGCLSSEEQSPFGLQSLFLQQSIEKSVECGALASATVHAENGFDELKYGHVKCSLKKTHLSEPFSQLDTDEDSCPVSKNDDCMFMSQQDKGIEGLSMASLDEGSVSSVFSLDAKHIKEVINSEEVACKGEGSKKLVHSDDLKASSEKTDVNGPADNEYGVSNAVLSIALHAPANDNYDVCFSSNSELLHQGDKDRCSEDTEERFASKPQTNVIIEEAAAKYIESEVVLVPDEGRSDQLNSKLEGAKVVEGLNFSKDKDNGSVVGIVGERTLSGSGLPKDSSREYNLRQELLDGSSVETFLDGSTTWEKNVPRVDTIENPSFSLATPGYKHEDALSEEAVRTMKKYAGTCSSNPRELLMDLQSLFSKENTEESDPHDGLALSSAESPGAESIDILQQVKVHLGSNLSQLGSTDLLDELIGCSKTEVLHQGHKDIRSEDREEQVASGPCTNDIVEAATAKYIQSGAVLLLSEERSNLKDGQLNSKQESPIVMESSLNNKDVTNPSINRSVVDTVDQRTPSGSGLAGDCRMDDNPQRVFLDGCSVESSLQGSTMFRKKIESAVAGTIGNPSFSLATSDQEHEGALSEEAVCKMKKCTGTRSADPKHLLMELQSLFSEGSIEKSDSHADLTFPSSESGRKEPSVCHAEKLVDTLVSSESDTYQGLRQDLSRAEEKASCMPISVQLNPELEDDEMEKHSLNCEKATSQILGITRSALSKSALLPKDSHTIYCQEQELPNDLSPLKSAKEVAICLDESFLGSGICQSHGQKHIVESNSTLSSCDTEVLHQDHKEESNVLNEEKTIPKVLVNDMPEVPRVEWMESAVMLPSVPGKSEISDELLNTKPSEKNSFSGDKDTIKNLCTGSTKNDPPLPKDCHIDSCQKQEVPDVLSLPKSPEESANCQDESVSGSGPCQTSWQQCRNESSSVQVTSNIEAFNQNHEGSDQNNEGQITSCIPSGVSEAADIERTEREIGLTPPAGPSALPDEQVDSKASSLHKDSRKDPPSDLSAPRSPEESTVFQNNSVPGSVGVCQSSRRRGIEELRAKLQSFKVSSTVKGSYIAMSAPRPKQGDDLSQSAIALLRSSKNAPAVKVDHPAKVNPDGSVAKD